MTLHPVLIRLMPPPAVPLSALHGLRGRLEGHGLRGLQLFEDDLETPPRLTAIEATFAASSVDEALQQCEGVTRAALASVGVDTAETAIRAFPSGPSG